MAEGRADAAVMDPPESAAKPAQGGSEKPARRPVSDEADQLAAKEQLLDGAPAGPRFPLNIPLLLREKLLSNLKTIPGRLFSLLKPSGPMIWVVFVLASLLVFFGSLFFAGVFNPREIVKTTKQTVQKSDWKGAVKARARRAIEIAKGGFSTAGSGLSGLKKIPAFFGSSYGEYKTWKKQRQKESLVIQQRKLHFDQQKINQAQKGLEKQSANLKEQEDKISAQKIALSQEEQRLVQFKAELKKREQALLKKQKTQPKGEAKGAKKEVTEGAPAPAAKEEVSLENIVRLSDIYKKMPADQAAEVVKEIDDELVIAIFAQMKERNVASILGEMDPPKAAALTKKMAEMGITVKQE